MYKKYRIRLTTEQRQQLLELTRCGSTTAQTVRRAQTLLMADSGLADRAIAELLHVHPRTVERTRQRAVDDGVEAALVDRPRPGADPLLDADQELVLTVLACTAAPDGRESWTMQLLADQLVELEVVPAISDETVRRALKKRSQALAEAAVEPAGVDATLRLADGGYPGALPRTVRPALPRRLSGRVPAGAAG